MSSVIEIPAPTGVANPGYYSDGHPFDEVHYLECKLILKPDPFTSVKAFLDYGALVRRQAGALGVGFANGAVAGRKPESARSAVSRRARCPPLQERLHSAPEDLLRGQLPGRRSGNRLQVPPSRLSKSCRAGCASEDRRALPDQVQGRNAAIARQDRRPPDTVFAQRAIRHEPGFGRRQRFAGDCWPVSSRHCRRCRLRRKTASNSSTIWSSRNSCRSWGRSISARTSPPTAMSRCGAVALSIPR